MKTRKTLAITFADQASAVLFRGDGNTNGYSAHWDGG